MKNVFPLLIIMLLGLVTCKPRQISHKTPVDEYEIDAADPSAYETRAGTTVPAQQETTPSQPSPETITDDNPPPQITLDPLKVSDSLLVSIERTPCFGTCPTYKFDLYKSGYAVYEGIRFVDSVGTFTARVPQERLQQLQELINEVNYFSFKDEYYNPYMADIPYTVTIVQHNGKVKRVLNGHEETPEQLIIFERFVDGIVQELGFTNKPEFDD